MTPCNRLTAIAAACLALAAPAFAQETADRIWSGGPILTMNDAAMRAEAVAEKGGKIVAVGTAAEVMTLKGAGTQVIDLAGRTMLPGFVDAHGHMFVGGGADGDDLPALLGHGLGVHRSVVHRQDRSAGPDAVGGLLCRSGCREYQNRARQHHCSITKSHLLSPW